MTVTLPVVFIHGLWLHSTSWRPWIDLFREEGYDPSVPGWPGDPDTVEDARKNPESVADYGIDDVVEHYAALIGALPVRPVVIGHSFGGMIAQKLLGQDCAAVRCDRSSPLSPVTDASRTGRALTGAVGPAAHRRPRLGRAGLSA